MSALPSSARSRRGARLSPSRPPRATNECRGLQVVRPRRRAVGARRRAARRASSSSTARSGYIVGGLDARAQRPGDRHLLRRRARQPGQPWGSRRPRDAVFLGTLVAWHGRRRRASGRTSAASRRRAAASESRRRPRFPPGKPTVRCVTSSRSPARPHASSARCASEPAPRPRDARDRLLRRRSSVARSVARERAREAARPRRRVSSRPRVARDPGARRRPGRPRLRGGG